MTKAEDKALVASINELYPVLVDAIIGYRKDVTASTISILLAEICLLGVDEAQAVVDVNKVAATACDHVKVLALRDAPTTGRMN